ncbi:MAG: VTT domain-containing protein [Myxococcales bacterium]
MARHWLRIVLLLSVLAAAIWLMYASRDGQFELTTLRDRLRAAGALSGVLFVVSFACLQPMGLPGHLFAIGASMIWPPASAIALSLLGAVLGQTLWFLIYRYIAHDWAQARLPPWLRRFEQALSDKPWRTIIVLRLLMFTSPLSPAILGVSRVRVAPMILASAIGLTPTLVLDVWLGVSLVNWLWH